MKNILILVLVTFMTFPLYSQEKIMEKVKKTILEMKDKYAPDKRTAIFNVEIKENEGSISLTGETTEIDATNELLSILEDSKIQVENNIVSLPAASLNGKTLGLINVSVANLRGEPRHSAELVTQSILGTPVRILKKHYGFFLIQTPDKYIAWVDDDGVNEINKEEYDNWYNSDKIFYLKEYGFSYSKANENSDRISDLVIGNILVKVGSEGKFVKVKYPDGRIGFVLKSEVQDFKEWLNNAYPTKENIIATAKLFMGNPYLWGGTSAKGLDCSGFTKTVYYLNGVILDRDASQQVKKGEPVDTKDNFNNLEKGDLLFFGFKAKDGNKERITHVGIYIDNLEYIHESGMVRFNSFDIAADNFNKYRLKMFIRAKRIISSVGQNGIEPISDNIFYNGELK